MQSQGERPPDRRELREGLVERLRRAGCVFAEDEARLLRAAAAEEGALERMVRRRTAGEFLEHVLGAVEIFGERLSVGPGVFVPRQRTALLIERTLDACRGRAAPTVLEACCGVAPIAALVARRHPSAQVHAMDRDETALRHAQKNLPASARTHRAESLAGLPPALLGRVDVLAAVPPYVPEGELAHMPREARDHEPRAALLGGPDGLAVVRRLLRDAPPYLAAGGELLLEMHRDQVPLAAAEAREMGAYRRIEGVHAGDGGTAVLHLEGE